MYGYVTVETILTHAYASFCDVLLRTCILAFGSVFSVLFPRQLLGSQWICCLRIIISFKWLFSS